MGDFFHQTNANQSSTNQQIGISTRDVGGSVVTGAAGSTTGSTVIGSGQNSSVSFTSLDPLALQAASQAINNALAANTATNQSALQAYQGALSAVAENQQATNQAVQQQGQSLLGQVGLNPSQVIWIAGLVVVAVLATGFIRGRR